MLSILRRQGLKIYEKLFWSKFNILGFVLSLIWISKLGPGSKLENWKASPHLYGLSWSTTDYIDN